MNTHDWDAIAFETKERMKLFVQPFVTPITRSDSPDYGWAWGSGTYAWVESARGAFLFTNEHVAAVAEGETLSHLPRPGAEYEAIAVPFNAWREPIEFACAPVDLSRLSDERDCLDPDQFDATFDPVPHELLFFIGFPGTTLGRWDPMSEGRVLYSWGNELSIAGFPVVCQAIHDPVDSPPERYDRAYHVLIHYPAAARQAPEGPEIELRNPRGISGSLLWDTKRVACLSAGVNWQPEFARVCGIIWAAGEQSPFLIATRIEHLHACVASLKAPTGQ